MRATIKEKLEVAKGTLFVTFDLQDEEVDFKPGQYFFVTLPDVGHQDEKGLRRHLSVVTSPNEKGTLGLATRAEAARTTMAPMVARTAPILDVVCERFTSSLLRSGDRPLRLLHTRAEAAKSALVET